MFEQGIKLPSLEERIKLSEEGKPGDPYCDNMGCTRMGWLCVGMHCSYCGGPCSSQGHNCSQRQEAERLSKQVHESETQELPRAS